MSLTFLSPWVLLGLASLAVPIVIHLILRKKPKHLLFPAFRFLQRRRKTNLRKLQLRHLLLLALRMLLFAAFALALARPLLSGGPAELAGNPDLAVLFLFDSSPSMSYVQDGKSRLDLAKDIAGSVIDALPAGSQIAVLDTGETGGRFLGLGDARRLVGTRRILPRNRPVTSGLEDAFRLLEKEAPNLPLMMCIFSDRTAASWDANAAMSLPKLPELEAKLKKKLKIVYFDLGAAQPRNVAIAGLSLQSSSGGAATPLEDLRLGVAGRTPVQFVATVEVTGANINNEVLLYVDGRLHDQQSLQVAAEPGQTVKRPVKFKPLTFASNRHSGEVKLRSADALEDDNVRYWTVQVSRRRVLIIAEEASDALDWKIALEALEDKLPVEVKVVTPSQVPADLAPELFEAVCVMNVGKPGQALWQTLGKYVTAGGGVVLLPGADCDPSAWNTEAAMAISPAKIKGQRAAPASGCFMTPNYEHPMMQRFKTWEQPITAALIYRYWEVEPLTPGSTVVTPYSDKDKPAIVERVFDRSKVLGRVVMFTTLMYRRNSPGWKDWNNFLEESGGAGWIAALALPYLSVEHVLGARGEPTNFTLGEEIRLLLPTGHKLTEYKLTGPQSGAGKIAANAAWLALPEIAKPGEYQVADGLQNRWSASFSVNLPQRETELVLNKPSPELLQETLGPDSVKPWTEGLDIRKMVRDKFGQAQETDLLPLLMVLCLVFMAAENFLANRFYRKETEEGAAK